MLGIYLTSESNTVRINLSKRHHFTSIIKVSDRRTTGMRYTFKATNYMNGYNYHFKRMSMGLFLPKKYTNK